MTVLLDTNAFIRYSKDNLPKHILRLIEKSTTEILVSMITPWEIVLKPSLIEIGMDSLQVRQNIDDLSARLIPLTLDHAEKLSQLPKHHQDPFDRMIIVQALVERVPVVSSDERFPLYAKQGLKVLWER